MEYMEEKSELIKRLRAQEEGIGNILALKSRGYSLITESVKSELEKLQKETQTIIRKLEKNEFKVAIVGVEKAGKSSFCNALIENNMLPTAEARCTYTSTCIISSSTSRAEVRFYTKQEFERDFQDKLAKLGIENHDKYSISSMTESQYKALYDNIDDEKKRLYEENINQEICDIIELKSDLLDILGREPKIFEDETVNSREFKDYITMPNKAMAVKEVIISSPLLDKMPNAIIYDVPGFNSPTEMHRAQTKKKMDSADAIIMVEKAYEPSITADSLKIFKENDADGTILAEKLFVFENKADRVKNLRDNIEIIYKEWGEKHKILHDKSRFFFGSSNARLQSLNRLDPDDTDDYKSSMCEKFSKLDNSYADIKKAASEEKGFGIVALREALEKYNNTERFKVIQRRAGILQENLFRMMTELMNRCPDIGDDNSGSVDRATALKFIRDFQNEFEKQLTDFRDNHKCEIASQKPLSRDMAEYIKENVVPDRYSEYINEKLELQKKKLNTISSDNTGSMNISDIENAIRKDVFSEMYEKDFSEKIRSIVSECHNESIHKMLDIFMECLGVSETSKHYKHIREALETELTPFTDTSVNYYQRLVERYSRDTYELLIQQRYSEERYTKFYNEMNSFVSMSVYYDNTVEPTDNGNLANLINVSLKDNIFCYQMLCHIYSCDKISETISEAEIKVKSILRTSNLTQEIISLITAIVRKDVVGAIDVIANAASEFMNDPDENNRVYDTKNQLLRLAKNYPVKGLFDVDITNREEFEPIYHDFFKHSRNYNDMINDLKDDIKILNDVLLHCFIRALALEKPYLANEYIITENILRYIESSAFIDFISRFIPQILESEYEEIENSRLERERNAACRREIEKIMSTINSAATD